MYSWATVYLLLLHTLRYIIHITLCMSRSAVFLLLQMAGGVKSVMGKKYDTHNPKLQLDVFI